MKVQLMLLIRSRISSALTLQSFLFVNEADGVLSRCSVFAGNKESNSPILDPRLVYDLLFLRLLQLFQSLVVLPQSLLEFNANFSLIRLHFQFVMNLSEFIRIAGTALPVDFCETKIWKIIFGLEVKNRSSPPGRTFLPKPSDGFGREKKSFLLFSRFHNFNRISKHLQILCCLN